MLKRIAVLGTDTDLAKAAADRAKDKELQIVFIGPRDAVPAATGALLATPEDAAPAVDMALNVAQRQEDMLLLLAEAIDCREEFRPGSSLRVKEHATRFAKALKLDPEETLTLERAALVRDVGKLRIPNRILLKDSVLTYDEWVLLRKHTSLGAEMLASMEGLKDTVEVVRRHHCNYDGTGYPDSLEGDQIPLLGRVLKLLDVYCAMTSPRHYRKGLSTHKDALDHLREERGKHFDPRLVDVFIKARVGRDS